MNVVKKSKNEIQYTVIVYEEVISLSLQWFHNIRVVVQMRGGVIQSTMILYFSVEWIGGFYRQWVLTKYFRDFNGRSLIFFFNCFAGTRGLWRSPVSK